MCTLGYLPVCLRGPLWYKMNPGWEKEEDGHQGPVPLKGTTFWHGILSLKNSKFILAFQNVMLIYISR